MGRRARACGDLERHRNVGEAGADAGGRPLSLLRERLADGALLAGGGALLASAFLPWARRGPGHSLHGHALVDAVVGLGNTVPGMSAARLTVLWYLVPACGAFAWLSAGARGPGSRVTRAVAVAALAAALGAFVLFGLALGFANLGTGAPVAVAGALLALAGAFTAPSHVR